jgi:hypothetical protein
VEDDEGTNGTSLLRGRVKPGEPGPLCHRLERLVHLELADLAVHAPYLEQGFPKATAKAKNAKANGTTSAPATPGRSPKSSKARMLGKPCADCKGFIFRPLAHVLTCHRAGGAVHKEIFTFQRVQKGKYKDGEWERLVQPVIAKWGRFVADSV